MTTWEFLLAHINWIAVSLSIGGILLNAKKIIWCWPVWILSNACWLVYATPKKEGAEILLWSVFALASAYGWYQWLYKKEDSVMNESFTVEQVKALCGGKLPNTSGFAWDRVGHFRLEDGVLQPYGGYGILPGPGIILAVTAKEYVPFQA